MKAMREAEAGHSLKWEVDYQRQNKKTSFTVLSSTPISNFKVNHLSVLCSPQRPITVFLAVFTKKYQIEQHFTNNYWQQTVKALQLFFTG